MNLLLSNIYTFVSAFGNSFQIPFIVTLIILIFLYSRKYNIEALLVIISSMSVLFSGLVKYYFKSPRPHEIMPRVPWEVYSFPSTHVVFYVAFFGYLLYLALKLRKESHFIRLFVGIFSAVLIILVGPSRVFLNMHWVNDVIGGYSLGASYLAMLLILDFKLSKKHKNHNN
jgi:undecaprenyl-diphosphatase